MTTPILLVEDDPSAQELIRALCERQGYAVDVAADGFLGLRLLSERRHAIVLIDYHLPEMDGYALARLMREIGGGDGRIRLVGITADAHGLALRRGADALFDAILVKPIVPDLLFFTLDRLARPEPEAKSDRSERPADALWRRRGLPHSPRAILCSGALPDAVAAVSQAFDLVPDTEPCDLVLVSSEASLDHLRALRAAGPARLVPAIDLTGRLNAVCDYRFAVTEAASWSALSELCAGFAHRRASLSPDAIAASDAAGRLIALLHVADRDLILSHAAMPVPTYETGHAPDERMSAILVLMQAGFLVCEPRADGLVARLTESGHRSLGFERKPDAQVAAATPAPAFILPNFETLVSEVRPSAVSTLSIPAPRSHPVVDTVVIPVDQFSIPIANMHTMEELRGLIGDHTLVRLHERLIAQATEAFASDASPSAIAHDAHVLISMSGTLGFERLFHACRALQAAIARGGPIDESLSLTKTARAEMMAWQPLSSPRSIGVSA